jgi:DNA gyrase/topoisomerase IV subunit A
LVRPDALRARISILEALEASFEHRHVVMDVIGDAEDRADAVRRLMAALDIDATQAAAITELRLLRWTRSQRDAIQAELRDLQQREADQDPK